MTMNKRMNHGGRLGACALFCLVAACAPATGGDATTVAGDALDASALVRENHELFTDLLVRDGVDEPLTPGEAIDEVSMRADELAALDPGRPLAAIVHDRQRRVVPLLGADGAVRTSMTVALGKDGWTLVRAGDAALGRAVVAARASLGAKAERIRLVRIPSMETDLVLSEAGGEPSLTALRDAPERGLVAGETRPAADVLPRLRAAAQRHLERTVDQ